MLFPPLLASWAIHKITSLVFPYSLHISFCLKKKKKTVTGFHTVSDTFIDRHQSRQRFFLHLGEERMSRNHVCPPRCHNHPGPFPHGPLQITPRVMYYGMRDSTTPDLSSLLPLPPSFLFRDINSRWFFSPRGPPLCQTTGFPAQHGERRAGRQPPWQTWATAASVAASPAQPCLSNKLLLTQRLPEWSTSEAFVDVPRALFGTTYFRSHTLLALENVLLPGF